MAFVPNFNHDVFVSFATIDNEPESEMALGWVSRFVEGLESNLARKLGHRRAKFWFDKANLSHTGRIGDHLRAAIGSSATLVVVLSTPYLESAWCRQEREAFLSALPMPNGLDRIILLRLDDSQAPSEFSEMVGYKFYCIERESKMVRTFGRPAPLVTSEADRPYFNGVEDVAVVLAQRLKEMCKPAPPPPSGPPVRDAVYLAEVPETLREEREAVRRHLEQAGIAVVPTSNYPPDPSGYEKALIKDLARAKVFAQLLDESMDNGGPRAPAGYIQLQLERAAGLEILQWCRPYLSPAVIKDHALLNGPKVQAVSLAEFKGRIVQVFAMPAAPASKPPRSARLVFVNANDDDRSLAERIMLTFKNAGHVAALSVREGPATKVREDFESAVRSCHAVLVVYESCTKFWVRDQMFQLTKILAQRDDPPTLAIYEGPPPPKKDPLGLEWPGLRYIRSEGELPGLLQDGPP